MSTPASLPPPVRPAAGQPQPHAARQPQPHAAGQPQPPGTDNPQPSTTGQPQPAAAAQPAPASAPAAADGHGWRAVSIVLVGAFMALLDSTTQAINTRAELVEEAPKSS